MPKKMAIIGGGLIGGSIAASLKHRKSSWEITCFDLPFAVSSIEAAGIFDRVMPVDDMNAELKEYDVVILAADVDAIMELLDQISAHLRDGTIVTDVGSTKAGIVKKAKHALKPTVFFVGGHPITGSEKRGAKEADPFLFKNKPYILCPDQSTDESALIAVLNIVEDLGALPVSVDPEEHDLAMAIMSHTPHLLAVALMRAALKLDSTHGLLDIVAGQSFLDMTRVAASDYELWKSILSTNLHSVEIMLDAFEDSLKELRYALRQGSLLPLWSQARQKRQEMEPRQPNKLCEKDLRNLVDALDSQLLRIIHKRFEAAKKIGAAKKKKGLPVLDEKREAQVKEQWLDFGTPLNLSKEFLEDLLAVLTRHSRAVQEEFD